MSTFKKCLPDLLAVMLFVVLSFAYFFPGAVCAGGNRFGGDH